MAMSFASLDEVPSMDFAGSSKFTEKFREVSDLNNQLMESLAATAINAKSRVKVAERYGRLKGAAGESPTSGVNWGGVAQGFGGAVSGVLGVFNRRSGNVSSDLKTGFESAPLKNWLS